MPGAAVGQEQTLRDQLYPCSSVEEMTLRRLDRCRLSMPRNPLNAMVESAILCA